MTGCPALKPDNRAIDIAITKIIETERNLFLQISRNSFWLEFSYYSTFTFYVLLSVGFSSIFSILPIRR